MELLSRPVDADGFLNFRREMTAMTAYAEPAVSANSASNRFAVLPNDETLAETVVGPKGHGLSFGIVDDLDAARSAVLARIPEGSSVMTFPSVTLEETGIAQAIDNGGPTTRRRPRGPSTAQPSGVRSAPSRDFTLQPSDPQTQTKGEGRHGNR